MKDYFGNTLEVGDVVAGMGFRGYRGAMQKGKIRGFSEKNVLLVRNFNGINPSATYSDPNDLVKDMSYDKNA